MITSSASALLCLVRFLIVLFHRTDRIPFRWAYPSAPASALCPAPTASYPDGVSRFGAVLLVANVIGKTGHITLGSGAADNMSERAVKLYAVPNGDDLADRAVGDGELPVHFLTAHSTDYYVLVAEYKEVRMLICTGRVEGLREQRRFP